jgi:hypothetical protein
MSNVSIGNLSSSDRKQALDTLSMMYRKGQGCEKSEEEADECLRRSNVCGGRLEVNGMSIGVYRI